VVKALLDGEHFRKTLELGGPGGDGSGVPTVALGLLGVPVLRGALLALRLGLALWLGSVPGFLLGWLALGAFLWERTLVAEAAELARTSFCPDGTLLGPDGETTFADGTRLDADGNIWWGEGDTVVLYDPVRKFRMLPEWAAKPTKAWEPTLEERPRLTLEGANRLVAGQRSAMVEQGLGLLENAAAQSLAVGAMAAIGGALAGVVMASGDAAPRQAGPRGDSPVGGRMRLADAWSEAGYRVHQLRSKYCSNNFSLLQMQMGTHDLSVALDGLYEQEFELGESIKWAMLKSGWQLHSVYAKDICLCHKKAHGAELQRLLEVQRALSKRIGDFEFVVEYEETLLRERLKDIESRLPDEVAEEDWLRRRVEAAHAKYGQS
jgi:hypothetical protein